MSGKLPAWLEHWLGIAPGAAGEGTAYALDNGWTWSPTVTLLFILAVLFGAVYFYAREGGSARWPLRATLVFLRLSLIALVLFLLAEFVLSLHRTGLPYLAIIVDESASMDTADSYDPQRRAELEKRVHAAGLEGLARLNLAKTVLLEKDAALLKGAAENYRVVVYFAAEESRPAEHAANDIAALAEEVRGLTAQGRKSRLGRAVRRALDDLRGTPPVAIILLSDGVTTEGETIGEVALAAQRKRTPLFLIGLGSPEAVRDVQLRDALHDDVVFKDDLMNVDVKVVSQGFAGRQVKVKLHKPDGGPTLAEATVQLGPDGKDQSVRLPWRPVETGPQDLSVEVEPLAEEAQANRTRNNRLPVKFTVRDDKLKVLMVQAYPSYEYRYLKQLLERESTVELKTVLQEADPEFAAIDKTALRLPPVSAEQLFEYHVVIFGDVNPGLLSPALLENLREFVEKKGGGLAVIAGPQYTPLAYDRTPLAELLPVDVSSARAPEPGRPLAAPFSPALTRLGQDSPHMQLGDSPTDSAQLWRTVLPGFYWLLEAPKLKPGARVLAEHPSRSGADGRNLPVVCTQYVGAGRVLFHATDDTWRWRYQVGDVYFQRYWIQAVRYLARSRLLYGDKSATVAAMRSRYELGEPAEIRVRFLDEASAPPEDDGVKLMIESPGQKSRRLTLARKSGSRGIFEGALKDLPAGEYHAWIAAPTLPGEAPSVDFTVEAPADESQRLQMNVTELTKAAKDSGGKFFTDVAGAELLSQLPEGRPVQTEPLDPIVLWHNQGVLLLFVTLLVSEWLLRKKAGMI